MNELILFNRNLSKDLVIVAEVGVNHAGSLKWILDFLPRLKESGATAVKFQLFTPDLYSTRSNINRHKFLNSVYLSRENFKTILKLGKEIDLPVFATPVSHDWVEFVAAECGVVKIASGDFTFRPTIELALNSDAQIIASTGATSLKEIQDFLHIANSKRSGLCETVALMHCVAAYPPPLSQGNLRAIPYLREISNLEVGFSSHFTEDVAIYAALALGARLFEVHVTDDRNRRDIRDHSLSRTPEELRELIENLNDLLIALSSSEKIVQPCEIETIFAIRKGLIYTRNLPKGHVITMEDLDYARPLNPNIQNAEILIGKVTTRVVNAFNSVAPEDFIEVIH